MSVDYRISAADKRSIVVFDEAADSDELLFAVDLPSNEQASKPMEDAIIGLVKASNDQQRALAMMSNMYEMLVSLGVEDSVLDRVESFLRDRNVVCTASQTDDDDVLESIGMTPG